MIIIIVWGGTDLEAEGLVPALREDVEADLPADGVRQAQVRAGESRAANGRGRGRTRRRVRDEVMSPAPRMEGTVWMRAGESRAANGRGGGALTCPPMEYVRSRSANSAYYNAVHPSLARVSPLPHTTTTTNTTNTDNNNNVGGGRRTCSLATSARRTPCALSYASKASRSAWLMRMTTMMTTMFNRLIDRWRQSIAHNDNNNIGDVPEDDDDVPSVDRSMASVHCPP